MSLNSSVLAFILSRLNRSASAACYAAARVITNLSARDHVKPALKELHRPPVEHGIMYKLCLLMCLIHIGQAPEYLTDCVSSVCSTGGRYRLRSPTLRTTF